MKEDLRDNMLLPSMYHDDGQQSHLKDDNYSPEKDIFGHAYDLLTNFYKASSNKLSLRAGSRERACSNSSLPIVNEEPSSFRITYNDLPVSS